jgi:hypothetical protein
MGVIARRHPGDSPHRYDLTLKYAPEETVELELVTNPPDRVTPVTVCQWLDALQCADLNYDLVLVDDQWGGSETEHMAGQGVLLPALFKKMPNAWFCLFTQHYLDENRMTRFSLKLRAAPYQGTGRLFAISKEDRVTLRVLLNAVIGAREQRAELEKRLQAQREIAHAPYALLAHTRHLVGIDTILLDTARAIEPFFQWKSGRYESIPKPLRRAFPTAILLEGEPGSGKTALCRAISEALGHEAVLPKHLGPLESPGKWKRPLENEIRTHYSQAADGQIVVIKADDLAWPTAAEISDAALAADWSAYMYSLRDCIADAARINAGKKPESAIVKGAARRFEGKIIWLFAKNTDDDVARMFSPLRDFLRVFRVRFPRDPQSRREIMSRYAESRGCTFDVEALNLAVDALVSYKGRDLVGHDDLERGFIPFCISSVQDREEARWKVAGDQFEPNMVVTADIVNAWLQGVEHRGIAAEAVAGDPQGQSLPQSCVQWSEPWMGALNASMLRELCDSIWASRGRTIGNDAETIVTHHGHGLVYLRATLAVFWVALRGREALFDEIFGFRRGKRKSMKVGRYVENKSKRYPDIFPASPGKKSYCQAGLDADGEALRQAGFWLTASP